MCHYKYIAIDGEKTRQGFIVVSGKPNQKKLYSLVKTKIPDSFKIQSVVKVTCPGCINESLSQEDHTSVGGCLVLSPGYTFLPYPTNEED